MDLLGESIKCTACKKILKMPVSLPCGHSICEGHVKKAANETMTVQIYCPECSEFFDIPTKGFPRNRALESLLKKNIEKIDLGEEYKSAIDKCSLFGDLLDRFEKIKNDPETLINNEISELKNQVDMRREELKEKIDKESLEMIEKLDEFERECKLKVDSLKSDSKLNEKFEMWKNSLKQWKQSLDTFERNNDIWNRILKESSSTLIDLHKEFINFNKELFLSRLNEFKYPISPASSKFITIKYEVKELSKYTDTTEKQDLYSHSVFIDGIEWFLNVAIENSEANKANKSDPYIGVYLYAVQNPRIRNLKVEFYLVILDQFGLNKSIVRYYDYVYEKNYGCGSSQIISLKDLFANCNLYNAPNDSCTVQAIVEKFEWI